MYVMQLLTFRIAS